MRKKETERQILAILHVKGPMRAERLAWEMRASNTLYQAALCELVNRGVVEKYYPKYFVSSRHERRRKLTFRLAETDKQ